MIVSVLWNCCKTSHQKHSIFIFLKFVLKKISRRSNVFIISELWTPVFWNAISLNDGPRSGINFTTETKRCRSDFQYFWHWLTWLASSVSIVHSDYLHLRLNVIVASLCSIDCLWLLCVRPVADSFLIRKCAHLVVSAHISLHMKQ